MDFYFTREAHQSVFIQLRINQDRWSQQTVILMDYLFQGQMVDAVAVVHSEGIVHFDLKAENFLCVGEDLKLSDFGIAAFLRHDKSHVSRHGPAGTLRYMAPEAIYQTGQKGYIRL